MAMGRAGKETGDEGMARGGQGGADAMEMGRDLGHRVGMRKAGIHQGLLGRANGFARIALRISKPLHAQAPAAAASGGGTGTF